MAVTRKRPAVEWWAVARLESQLRRQDVHHATFGGEREVTLCGLPLIYDTTVPVEDRYTSKRMKSRVTDSGKPVKPCQRCVSTIDRHKQMYGIHDTEWPYATFKRELSHA